MRGSRGETEIYMGISSYDSAFSSLMENAPLAFSGFRSTALQIFQVAIFLPHL